MSTTVPDARPARWHMPHLESEDRIVSGTASGIAAELGVDPLAVRLAFVVLAVAGGVGLGLSALCWFVMVLAGRDGDVHVERVPKAGSERLRVIGIGLVLAGALLALRGTPGFADAIVWPAFLLAAGAVVAVDRAVWAGDDAVGAGAAPFEYGERRWAVVRVAAGLALAGAGAGLAAVASFDLRTAAATALAVAIALAGVWLIVAPWGWRLIRELGEERRARIRSEERADMAAHLHDSVLQTLALIQRSADDPRAMARHARRQERELRAWLYGGVEDRTTGRFRSALEATVAEVEAVHGVPIEVVVVGDADLDDRLESLLAASREAVTNSSVHSGTERIDVFAEVTDDATEVFVRDTGVGFDPGSVDPDRRGVRDSIVGRLERLGGRARVISAPGRGTEVEIHIARNGR